MAKKFSRRRPIAVIDAETDPFKKGRVKISPFLWGFYDGKNYEEFTSIFDMVEFLAEQPIITYAHNGGKFDYHFIWDFMDVGEPLTVINGRIAKFKIGECEFRDSYNLLPVPLAQMQKDKIDYKIFEADVRNKPENWKKIRDYLYGDCVYLWNWVNQFIDEYGLHLTTAGTAMHKWQHMTGIKAPEDYGGVLYNELKRYYYGGRCECWHYGEIGTLGGDECFTLADIHSAYPNAMLSKHPIATNFYMGAGTEDFNRLALEQRQASFLTVKGVAKGCFPYRNKDGSLVFPDDNISRTYNVTGWEYIASQDTRTFKLERMHEIYYFDDLIDFAPYVNHFYELKKASPKDSPGYLFAKLLMNALYGKFGANPDEYREFQTGAWWMLDEDGNAGDWEFNCAIPQSDELIIISKPQPFEKQRFYNIATAASITGFERAYLWRGICKTQNVLYCDTDSIAARNVEHLEFGEDLGQWELENTFDYGAFAGKKLYAMHVKGRSIEYDVNDPEKRKNWKVASKGVKATPDDIIRLARGEKVTFEAEAPTFSIHSAPRLIDRDLRMQKKQLADDE